MSKNAEWSTNRLLSTAARLVEHSWNERLAALGVTHAGYMALDVLREHGTLSQARLAQEVRVQAQTMGKTLHRLEVHGHISRSPNLQDRRSHLVSITEAGQNVLQEASRQEGELIDDGTLADEQLRRSLAHIISTLGASRWKLDVDAQGTVHELDADPDGADQDRAGQSGAGQDGAGQSDSTHRVAAEAPASS